MSPRHRGPAGAEGKVSERTVSLTLLISVACLVAGCATQPAPAGKVAIAAKDWNAAIRSLSSAALRDTRSADIENYLGYAYRQSGQLPLAFTHYQRALQLDPRHRGAHEYIGEVYLMANNLTKAEEHLAALQRI